MRIGNDLEKIVGTPLVTLFPKRVKVVVDNIVERLVVSAPVLSLSYLSEVDADTPGSEI